MSLRKIFSAAVMAACVYGATPVMAQDSSYTRGTVWDVANIETAPGQFENYMDWLSKNWKKIQEAGKKDGLVVSYHVYQVFDPRKGEPDVFLVTEYKDFPTTAQRAAMQKKAQELMTQDPHTAAKASGERSVMRTLAGSTQMQEIMLK